MPLPQKQLYTESDYNALPENVRAELIDGQIYYQAAPSRTVPAHLTGLLRSFLPVIPVMTISGN